MSYKTEVAKLLKKRAIKPTKKAKNPIKPARAARPPMFPIFMSSGGKDKLMYFAKNENLAHELVIFLNQHANPGVKFFWLWHGKVEK